MTKDVIMTIKNYTVFSNKLLTKLPLILFIITMDYYRYYVVSN